MATRQAGRRRLDSSTPAEYDLPTRTPRIASPELAHFVMSGVFLLWVIGAVGAGTAVVAIDLAPTWVARPADGWRSTPRSTAMPRAWRRWWTP